MAQVQSVDIPSPGSFYAQQRQSNWCWAACNQMVLNAVGIGETQENQVVKLFGRLVDQGAGGNFQLAAQALAGTYSTTNGRSVTVQPYVSYLSRRNPNDVFIILDHIRNGIPLVMATTMHGRVCVGVDYVQSQQGVQITAFRLMDPAQAGSIFTVTIQEWLQTGMGFMTVNLQ